MKVFATGLLVAAAAVFIVARANEDGPAWVGYVRAFAEAAMVGALADWFAVTALFRYPLGIPIPHTAIIPKRKDQIGRSLGEFVQDHFLTKEVLTERLHGAHVGRRLGLWLRRTGARRAGGRGDRRRDARHDRSARRPGRAGRPRRARRAPPARTRRSPRWSARRSTSPSRAGTTSACSTPCSRGCRRSSTTTGRRCGRASTRSRRGGSPSRSTTGSSTSSSSASNASSTTSAATRTTRSARRSTSASAQFAERLRNDPALLAKGEEVKRELLAHRDVQAWLQSLWGELKQAMLDAAGDPQSELRRRLTAGLARAGERLVDDAELQAKLDGWVERIAGYVVDNYRGEAAT